MEVTVYIPGLGGGIQVLPVAVVMLEILMTAVRGLRLAWDIGYNTRLITRIGGGLIQVRTMGRVGGRLGVYYGQGHGSYPLRDHSGPC